MCKKMMLFAPLAVLASACSEDNELVSGKADGSSEATDYVCVKIVQPKSVGLREITPEDFENGSDEENSVRTGWFFLFNSDGTPLTDDNNKTNNPQITPLTPMEAGNTGTNSAVEQIYHAILVVDGVKADKKRDLQIVCVLNAPNTLLKPGEANTLTLADLAAKIGDYGTHESGSFIMTNSFHKEGGADVLGTTVHPDDFCSTADQALNKPVHVYVERVVAKVRVKSKKNEDGSDGFKNDGADVVVDGKAKHLAIKITGIEIANIAQRSYLLKNIDKSWDDSTWVWDETNKRCYWETVPASMTYGNKSYDDITPETFDENNISLPDEYVQPNTSGQKTAVLVTAQLLDEENTPFEFVYLRGGYFTPEYALRLVAEYVAKDGGYYKKTSEQPETYSTLNPEDFEWENKEDNPGLTWLESYEVVAKVRDGVDNLYKRGENGEFVLATAEEINTFLAGTEDKHPYVARVYKDGRCYYFVNIDQTPVATDNGYTGQDKFEGVVRNHIYDLTVNSIIGIGTPVFDPTDVIIPEKPEDEDLFYLGANVNVLAWRIVGQQTVDFGGL